MVKTINLQTHGVKVQHFTLYRHGVGHLEGCLHGAQSALEIC